MRSSHPEYATTTVPFAMSASSRDFSDAGHSVTSGSAGARDRRTAAAGRSQGENREEHRRLPRPPRATKRSVHGANDTRVLRYVIGKWRVARVTRRGDADGTTVAAVYD
jgi:hypothetical protein